MQRANALEKTLMLGKTESRRRSGWQKVKWLDDITDSMGMSLSKPWVIEKDREAWSVAVHGVTKSRTRLSDWTTATDRVLGIVGGIGKAVGTLSLKDSQPPIQADIMSDTTFHPQDDSQFPHQSHSLSSPGFSMLQKKKIRDLRDHSTQWHPTFYQHPIFITNIWKCPLHCQRWNSLISQLTYMHHWAIIVI